MPNRRPIDAGTPEDTEGNTLKSHVSQDDDAVDTDGNSLKAHGTDVGARDDDAHGKGH